MKCLQEVFLGTREKQRLHGKTIRSKSQLDICFTCLVLLGCQDPWECEYDFENILQKQNHAPTEQTKWETIDIIEEKVNQGGRIYFENEFSYIKYFTHRAAYTVTELKKMIAMTMLPILIKHHKQYYILFNKESSRQNLWQGDNV